MFECRIENEQNESFLPSITASDRKTCDEDANINRVFYRKAHDHRSQISAMDENQHIDIQDDFQPITNVNRGKRLPQNVFSLCR